jgi:hypothetical protein
MAAAVISLSCFDSVGVWPIGDEGKAPDGL